MYSSDHENLMNDLLDFINDAESFIDISVATDAIADVLELADQSEEASYLIFTYRQNAEFYLKASNQEIVRIWKTLTFKERFTLFTSGKKQEWFKNKRNELKFNAELRLNSFLYDASSKRQENERKYKKP